MLKWILYTHAVQYKKAAASTIQNTMNRHKTEYLETNKQTR